MTCTIWLPFHLFSYYLTYFVPAEMGFDSSEWLTSFVQSLLWMFHSAAIIITGKDPTRPGLGFIFRESSCKNGPKHLINAHGSNPNHFRGDWSCSSSPVYTWVRLMYMRKP